MTPQQIKASTGASQDRACTFAPLLSAAMEEFCIVNEARQAAFLAQIGHESGGLHWLVEIWGPTDAQARYEGRLDLGNTEPGDGYRYRGRGLIQLTGRANYREAGTALEVDLLEHPEKLGQPGLACRSAAWFWHKHGCNELADSGDFDAITLIINGGLTGNDARAALWESAKLAIAEAATA